jgi:hypothetical protein
MDIAAGGDGAGSGDQPSNSPDALQKCAQELGGFLGRFWETIVFSRDYQNAVRGYYTAAGKRHPEKPAEAAIRAGKGIKEYLKDLWMAFILVVR